MFNQLSEPQPVCQYRHMEQCCTWQVWSSGDTLARCLTPIITTLLTVRILSITYCQAANHACHVAPIQPSLWTWHVGGAVQIIAKNTTYSKLLEDWFLVTADRQSRWVS